MTISQKLWQSNQDLVQNCLKHKFVQEIAQGQLDHYKFAFYLGQDAFFLKAFARAYSIAAAKTPDWQGFESFYHLAGGVLTELNIHQNYATKWGVDLSTVKPVPATCRYTDFLLATAWGKDVGTIAVAMTPCMCLYHFIGQQLAKNGIPNHQYSDWIAAYSSQEFADLAQHLENLVNRYGSLSTSVGSTYRYALECEQDFFTAAWEVQQIKT